MLYNIKSLFHAACINVLKGTANYIILFLKVDDIIELIMSHLWAKIVKFFLEEKKRLFIVHSYLLIDFESNAPFQTG